MPFTAIKASYRPNDDGTYTLFRDGQFAGCVSSLARAKRFVASCNRDDKRIRDTLKGKRVR